ncbi:LamG domain-containing protein [Microbispora sp. GKU 823]|uniref:LamG domain-containing protein n=1 Tax=Microbispora sp. GKU 823 TaxID=1652100 RepID=UPI0009A3E6E6|nr:LamG domain-containing protein [Microbispora sp. GKU 823]OPG11395.1 hypothetical protein B1L11_20490 [Microbispora sp. GKU 823]
MAGLVAAYGMNESTGTTVADSSGQNNTGAARDTSWATGRHGGALSFNGTSSWVTIPHAPSLRLTNALTLSAWVRPAALGTVWRSVLMKEHAEAGGGYGLYAATEYSAPAGWLQTAEEGGALTGSSQLPLNQWSHLAFTYDGGMATVYVNGAQVSQAPIAGEVIDDGGALRIGGNAFWGEFFSGLIDEVRVYNRAQSAAEIQADMNTPIPTAPTPTSAERRTASTGGAPGIAKLAVSSDEGASGATELTVWVSDPRGVRRRSRWRWRASRPSRRSPDCRRTNGRRRRSWPGPAR